MAQLMGNRTHYKYKLNDETVIRYPTEWQFKVKGITFRFLFYYYIPVLISTGLRAAFRVEPYIDIKPEDVPRVQSQVTQLRMSNF